MNRLTLRKLDSDFIVFFVTMILQECEIIIHTKLYFLEVATHIIALFLEL
jgi:hypothetical protein